MPIQIHWDRIDRASYDPRIIAAVRQVSREGTLSDVAADKGLVSQILRNIRDGVTVSEGDHRLAFVPTEGIKAIADESVQAVRGIQGEQSNTTALIDDTYVMKIYRKLENGPNPEIEMGRFLTDLTGFKNTPALLGSVELQGPELSCAAAVVHAFVENQGDAWSVTAGALDRFVEGLRLVSAPDLMPAQDEKAGYQLYMSHAGQRVAEMQLALASREDVAGFEPELVSASTMNEWISFAAERAEAVFSRLSEHTRRTTEDRATEELLTYRGKLTDHLRQLLPEQLQLHCIRQHGDLHLGQMLVVRDDIFIIDFEGEPRRTLEERRSKAPAARDIAGLIRSIDYSTSAALLRALKVGVDDDGRIAAELAIWRDEAILTLLTSYRSAMSDARLWPVERTHSQQLLRFFLLEKAFYEIGYELSHRPEWLPIAIGGALRSLQQEEAF